MKYPKIALYTEDYEGFGGKGVDGKVRGGVGGFRCSFVCHMRHE